MKTKYCILIIRFKIRGGGVRLYFCGFQGGGGVIVHCINNFLAGGGGIQNNGSKFQPPPPPDTQIMSSPLRPIQQSFSYVGTALPGLKDKCVLHKDTTL